MKITRDEATYGDVIDQYWISQFVIHRESYDYNSIQVDYDAMSLMVSGDVADEYLSMFKARTALISGWVTLKERPFISTR